MGTGGARLANRSLYLCTPDRPDLDAFVAACLDGGVDIVQLREKHLEARALLQRAEIVRRRCLESGVPFIMNDRPDLALAAGADGVHVGQDDVAAEICRSILGPDAIVGLSTHHPDELDAAFAHDLDYFAAGPVVETPTKPGRPGTGVGYVELAAEKAAHGGKPGSPLPFFVTGGVTPASVESLAAAGARGFVVVRYLTEAADPRRAAQELRRAIDASRAN